MAQDMILEVKETVARVIATKVDYQCIPAAVEQFLRGPWEEVLKIIGIRDGCEGKAWDCAVSAIDDLVFSVQLNNVVNHRRYLSGVVPRILQTIRQGLLLIYYEEEEINRFFTILENIHLNAARWVGSPVVNTPGETKTSGAVPREHTDLFKDIGLQTDKQQAFELDVSDPVLRQSEFFDAVTAMPLGTWVEFQDSSGVKRGKLAWKCDFTGEFTFIDRMYKVIADVSMRDLISCFEHGSVRITNETPLIERAVGAVANRMRLYVGWEHYNQKAFN